MYECLMNLPPSLLEPPHTRARLSAQAEVLIGMHKRDEDEIPSRAHMFEGAHTRGALRAIRRGRGGGYVEGFGLSVAKMSADNQSVGEQCFLSVSTLITSLQF